jgi:NAD+ kinase
MKRILLCPNTERDPDLLVSRRLLNELRKRSIETGIYLPFDPVPDGLSADDLLLGEPGEIMRDVELLICLGGDGTMLRMSKLAARYNVPMLGINMGHLGFITELELEEMDRLEEILEGKYTLEKRMMLDVEVRRENELVFTGFGLNEAVVSRPDPAHAIRLTAYGDNRKISDYAGDGIIIATPTGSTAYSMAAGGPIVEPTAENLILTPLCAHSLTAKAYVLTGDRRTSVKLLKADGNDAQLLIDGRDRFPLLVGDLIYVRKSELYCRLVKVMDRSFYEIVKNKLNQ